MNGDMKEDYALNGNTDKKGVVGMKFNKVHDSVDGVDDVYVNVANGKTAPPSSSGSGSSISDDKEEKKEPEPTVDYYQIFRYADSLDYLLLFLGTVCAIGHGASLPIMFIFFGDMTGSFVDFGTYAPCNFTYTTCVEDGYVNPNTTTEEDFYAMLAGASDLNSEMAQFSLYYVYIAIAVLVLASVQVACYMLQAVRQVNRIRLEFFRSILRQDISFFDLNSAGELNTRLADDISKIQAGISDKVSVSLQMLARAISGLVIGFVYGWQLALVILAVSPLLGISASVMFRIAATFTKKELDAYAKAGAVAEEVISSIRTVVAFHGQDKEVERYDVNLQSAKAVGIRKGMTTGLGMGVVFLIMFCTYGLAFWYGSTLVFAEGSTFGIDSMLTTFFGVLIGAFSLGGAGSNMEYFAAAKAAAYKVFEIIDRVPEIDCMSNKGHKPDSCRGEITFKQVDFTYPSREDVQILHKVSYTAESGKTTALCGQSGCGKSTCVQLIQRFYDPQNGIIELDGRDIRTLNVRWLRDHIGVVSQEPILFDTSIKENIRYGRDDVSDNEIIEATKQSNAYDFIMKLPNKFDTNVGEGGAQMSGGQKQRIAIARAIVRNPKIMLLDEATSALDTESESVVQAALEKASQGRTTLVIAHRLSTIKNSDKIIGFHEGRAMEQGSHDDLLKVENGIYQNLVHMQSYTAEEGAISKDARPLSPKASLRQVSRQSLRKRLISTTSIRSDTKHGAEETEDEPEEDEELPEFSFSRVMAMNKPETFYIICGCLSAAINGGLQPVFAILFAEIIGAFAQPDEAEKNRLIVLYSLLFVAIGATAFIVNILQATSFAKSGEELTMRLRNRGFRAVLRQEMGYYDDHRNSTGALTTRLATDASKVQGCTGVQGGVVVQSICALGVALGIAFGYSWQLTLLTLGFVPLMAVAGMLQMKVFTGQASAESKAFEDAGQIATEATLNIRTVASLTKEPTFEEKYRTAMTLPYEKAKRKTYVYGVTFGFSQAIVFFAYAATFRFGAWLVEECLLDFQNVFKVLMAVIFGAFAVGQTSSFAPNLADAKIAATRMFKLFDRVPEIDSYSEDGKSPKSTNSKVDYSKVKFNYPTRPDVQVLKGLNLGIEPGKRVALVGQSGCGKSTCIQLLERFYDPVEGAVYLDEKDLKNLNISWLRSQMGIVSQEPILFDKTIAENIRYGDNLRVASMDEVVQAAKNANIHSFIQGLPDGYNTGVGGKGAQLSGGQKQRVAIARALLRNPKILLLDEATSALDAESEKVVQDALDAASENRTSIIIAHRLSTIKNADVICVIENGAVVEKGTHSELIALHGSYYSLVNAQLHTKGQ
uniref:Multidrug resistance protein 1A-like n=1 Tax=Phallusia mammillata TaxID=59560 RepID=A0A6F9D672_9ASCI|nr:multidrug resistance protein 1A-like [Phallusia mammillata]